MFDDLSSDARSDAAVLRQLGADIAAARLARNWSQLELAERAGVGKRTLERLEGGESSTTANLVRILRALGLLSALDGIAPREVASPLAQLRAERGQRRRASPATTRAAPARRVSGASARASAGEAAPFLWGDEAPGDAGPS